MKGRGLVNTPIYLTFRYNQDFIKTVPVPPITGTNPVREIFFEYLSRGWVVDNTTNPVTTSDQVKSSSDSILFDGVMIVKFLKLRFLEAKGFDTTAAQAQFQASFLAATSKNEPSPIINAGRSSRAFPYLNWYNIPDVNWNVPP
jgi:hypothetical protein